MGDLISRSALIERMNDFAAFCATYKPYMSKDDIAEKVLNQAKKQALRLASEAPTVDAVPVVHASWERIPYSFAGGYRCSCCGQKSLERTFNYCGNCGADMRKKVQDA